MSATHNTGLAISNTSKSIGRVVSVRTNDLRSLPRQLTNYTGAVLSSVVPAATKRICRWLDTPPIIVSAETDLGIGICYPNRKQIGPDRLANAVGVANLLRCAG